MVEEGPSLIRDYGEIDLRAVSRSAADDVGSDPAFQGDAERKRAKSALAGCR
jgi:hypothetical protein